MGKRKRDESDSESEDQLDDDEEVPEFSDEVEKFVWEAKKKTLERRRSIKIDDSGRMILDKHQEQEDESDEGEAYDHLLTPEVQRVDDKRTEIEDEDQDEDRLFIDLDKRECSQLNE